MASDLLSYLMEERTVELRAKLQTQMRTEYLHNLQRTLQEAFVARFPTVPTALTSDIWRLSDPAQFQHLIIAVIRFAALNEFRQQLAQAVAAS